MERHWVQSPVSTPPTLNKPGILGVIFIIGRTSYFLSLNFQFLSFTPPFLWFISINCDAFVFSLVINFGAKTSHEVIKFLKILNSLTQNFFFPCLGKCVLSVLRPQLHDFSSFQDLLGPDYKHVEILLNFIISLLPLPMVSIVCMYVCMYGQELQHYIVFHNYTDSLFSQFLER